MKTARATANAPLEGRTLSCRSADDGVARAAGVVLIDDDSDFEGRETYQDDIEDISPFTVADGDDDEMFVIEMSIKKGCLRCGAAFFARGKCLQCGADDPAKRMMGCG